MADFTYTALRKLKSGHSADTQYTISIDLQQGDPVPSPVQNPIVALSGRTVTTVHRLDEVVPIVTDYVGADTTPDIDDMREFLYSVIHREQFQFNDGSGARDCILDSNPVPARAGILFTWSFSIRFV